MTLPEAAHLADLVTSTTVDGVPVLLAPAEGPVMAGILFRVGRTDEMLSVSGVTHLVEHLALSAASLDDVHHNGETGDVFTHFHVAGREAQVVAFLNTVCASLRDLPVGRLEAEKGILRTEAARGVNRIATLQRHERDGAIGTGVAFHGELGLNVLDADAVRAWAAEHFTSGNAVVWMTTDTLPEGLDLRLPAGDRVPVPERPGLLQETPAYVRGYPGGMLLDAIVPRSTATVLFTRVMNKALYRELRQEGEYSYEVVCDHDVVDAERTRVSLYADALPEQQAALVGAMVDALAAVRAGTIDPRDLETARDPIEQSFEAPWLGARMLPAVARDLLLGAAGPHPSEYLAEVRATTAEDVAEVADAVWNAALAQLPEGDLEWAGFTRAPAWSADVVEGTAHEFPDGPGYSLVIGIDGVSFVGPDGASTVRFADCAAYLVYPDGARRLIGRDGFSVWVEPTLVRTIAAESVRVMDGRVDPAAVIPMPARPDDQIPRPPAVDPGPRRGLGVWATVLAVPLLVYAFLLLSYTLTRLGSIGQTVDGTLFTAEDAAWGTVTGVPTLLVGIVLLVARSRRKAWKRAAAAARP